MVSRAYRYLITIRNRSLAEAHSVADHSIEWMQRAVIVHEFSGWVI